MKKIIVILFLFVSLSCEEATIEPIPPDIQQPTKRDSIWGDYFPNSVGSFWEYNVIIEGSFSHKLNISIEKRILINKKISASVWNFKDKNGSYKNYVAIIEDSVFFFTNTQNLNEAKSIIKQYILPLNIFRNWNARLLDLDFGSDRISGGSIIGKVNVPAGNFDNVIELERIIDAKDEKSHQWLNFVEGIGLIRLEKIDNSTNNNIIWELVNYQIKN